MIKYIIIFFCSIFFILGSISNSYSQGKFFREHWAKFDSSVSNYKENQLHWRVNDEEVSLHENFGKRWEAKANGLILITVPEDLFQLKEAELFLEIWGGHPHLENKRFTLNGRGPYFLPESGTVNGHCTYSYPTIPLKIQHLVNGSNVFQFTCNKGKSFWGHYIVENAAVRCYLSEEHPDLQVNHLDQFSAKPVVSTRNNYINDFSEISLSFSEQFVDLIDSVEYFARYSGYDDNGLNRNNYWHGFTLNKKYINHVGKSSQPPFKIIWDTQMIPDQSRPMALKALVHLKENIKYFTTPLEGLIFSTNRPTVRMYSAISMPDHFSSRISREQIAFLQLPEDLAPLDRAQLLIKNWGSHTGTNPDPFKINKVAYSIFDGEKWRICSFTKTSLNIKHLKPGINEFSVFSDTKHHGIEIFLPGPVLICRFKK